MISQHIPVMMKEAMEALNVRDNLDYIDATFGGGGYSEEILKREISTGEPLVYEYNQLTKIYSLKYE